VRLSGKVVPGSIATDATSGVVTFQVTDGTTTLDVAYDGAAPDTLKDNAEAVAEGQYADGEFEAKTLFAKCPSKFGTQTPTEGV
jgi:cytochrome c-type biogenesis protein CcmE